MRLWDAPLWFLTMVASSAALLVTIYWAIVIGRVLRSRRLLPSIRAGQSTAAPTTGWPRVSVIVPAHNEERVLADCLTSLMGQDYPDLEVILVLDRCTDRSAELARQAAARDPRLKIIENSHCPEDWAGKCFAAHRGAEAASGQWLLFTDADTWFHPTLVRASVATALREQTGLLSLLSDLRVKESFEWIAQPVASLNLIRLFPLEKVSRAYRARPFANGQFLLFDRATYDRIGGHAAVRTDLLEDLAFARQVYAGSERVMVLLSEGLLRCAMYGSAEAFNRGWKRIFTEACRRRPSRLRKNAWLNVISGPMATCAQFGAILTGIVLAMGGKTSLDAIAPLSIGLTSLGVQTITLAWLYRIGSIPMRAVLLYPLGCWQVGRILWEAARDLEARRPIQWGGRAYVLEPQG